MKKHSIAIGTLLFVVLMALILVTVKKGNYYRISAEAAHQVTLSSTVFVTPKTMDSLCPNPLLLLLSEVSEKDALALDSFVSLKIKPTELLSPDNKKAFNKHSGELLIYSQDKEKAANTWVLLSRMGFKKLFVFDEEGVSEFNYSFEAKGLSE